MQGRDLDTVENGGSQHACRANRSAVRALVRSRVEGSES